MKVIYTTLFWVIAFQSVLSMDKYPSVSPQTSFVMFLLRLGAKTNSLFTLEQFTDDASPPAPDVVSIDIEAIKSDWEPKAAIENYFPAYEVLQDPSEQNVFHVKDKRLKTLSRYPLDIRANFEYSGSVTKYVGALGETVPGMVQGLSSPGRANASVLTVPITVAIDGLTARELLSVPVDTNASKGILWTATSQVIEAQAVTAVLYSSWARFVEAMRPIRLPYLAELTPDSYDGTHRKCDLTGAALLKSPQNAAEGATWECLFTASGGDRVLTIDSLILFPSASTFSRSVNIPAGKRCSIILKYDGSAWMLTSQQGMY